MDPAVTIAVIVLGGSVITGAYAIFGKRVGYQGDFVDDVREDNRDLRLEKTAHLQEIRDMRKQRDDAVAAASHALTRLGIVEKYAHEVEEQAGIPHREWQHDLDTFPELQEER